MSTTESEYISAAIAAKDIVWIRLFLNECKQFDSHCKTTLYMDNQSAIRLIKNPEFHERTKHIDIKYTM